MIALSVQEQNGKTIQAYKKQVKIGQDQVRVSQEQQFNRFRPVLYPIGGLENIIDRSASKPYKRWGHSNQEIDGLRNIGLVPAFNIYVCKSIWTRPPSP